MWSGKAMKGTKEEQIILAVRRISEEGNVKSIFLITLGSDSDIF